MQADFTKIMVKFTREQMKDVLVQLQLLAIK